jgi:hypothetical protein
MSNVRIFRRAKARPDDPALQPTVTHA